MLHWIAFVVLGLVIGAAWGWWVGGPAKQPLVPLIGGLIGGLVGGRVLLLVMAYSTAKYVSILTCIVLALVLAWAGRAATGGGKTSA